MVAKNDSIVPEKVQSTSGSAAVPGVTGRTPEVPPDTQGIVEVTMRPIEHQVNDAPEAANEIKQPTQYRKDFGNHAPDPILLATLLSQAAAFSEETARAQAWLDYLTAQRDRAWHQALATVAKFKPHFDLADASDPNIATRYASMKSLVSARSVVVARGVSTRRKTNAAKKPPKGPA